MTDRARASERGLTLFEALVMLAVTALIGALVLPMTSNAVTQNRARAESALEGAAHARGEVAFRALINAAANEAGLNGDSGVLTFIADPGRALPCAPEGTRALVSLSLEQERDGARLVCANAADRAVLAQWRGGAVLSYSSDGVSWTRAWRGAGALDAPEPNAPAPFVRLETADGAWIERAGTPATYAADQ